MFNAMNAISDESSLLTVTPLQNYYLIGAILFSVSIHCMILYVPFFNEVFGIMPLDLKEWILVICFSIPVIFIDELIKLFVRNFLSTNTTHAIKHEKTN